MTTSSSCERIFRQFWRLHLHILKPTISTTISFFNFGLMPTEKLNWASLDPNQGQLTVWSSVFAKHSPFYFPDYLLFNWLFLSHNPDEKRRWKEEYTWLSLASNYLLMTVLCIFLQLWEGYPDIFYNVR